jgi:hypothetical protein
MLNVLIPCCKGDENQAIQLLEWIAELGKNDARCYILCAEECQHDRLVELGNKAFTQAQWIRDSENVKSNWREDGHLNKSAAGPNSLFRQAAWHFCLNNLGPWLFLEPDAIPCRKDWLTLLDSEYHKAGKPFMGFIVTRQSHPGDVGKHMSGVGVYPQNTPGILKKAILGTGMAFDVAGADTMVPLAHDTRTIFHRYRPPGFTTQEDFDERVKPEYALYHACKDGSILPFLRSRMGLDNSVAGVTESGLTVRAQERVAEPCKLTLTGSQPSTGSNPVTCDIFIKTREHDYPWLEWCNRSIAKLGSGFRKLQLVSDDEISCGAQMKFGSWEGIVRWDHTPMREPGYLWQQRCKLYADQWTDAEWILYQDSDTVFTRSFSPSDFIRDGKPTWLYDPLDKARPDQHAWIPVMEKFLGKKPEHEFMRRHPFVVPRWALAEMRQFCRYKHGKSLEDYIMGEALPGHPLALRFSEWNCLGFFLWEFHHDKVCWLRPEEAGPAFVWQGFTHGGEKRMHEDLAKFRELLEGNPEGVVIDSEVVPEGKTVNVSESAGGHNLTIPSAIEFLLNEARKDGFAKGRILRQLKLAGLAKGEKLDGVARPVAAPRKALPEKKAGTLLCIHSYPGANETFARHWTNYQKFGADRIVGIGTEDNHCVFPCESVNIGPNAYMKIGGKDDHLCRRLLDTVKWCLTQSEDHFAIIEYDTIPLKKIPKWNGVCASLTGGQVNGSKATQFFHNPWLFTRDSGPELVRALEAALGDSAEYPDNSPDLYFGLACERAGIKVGCNFKLFTRNRLDAPGDLDLAVEAAENGAHVIHGVKTEEEYNSIMRALNEQHLSLSHAQ